MSSTVNSSCKQIYKLDHLQKFLHHPFHNTNKAINLSRYTLPTTRSKGIMHHGISFHSTRMDCKAIHLADSRYHANNSNNNNVMC